MKLISKHHDYYDSSISYGIDNTLIFKRKNDCVSIEWSKLPRSYVKKSHMKNGDEQNIINGVEFRLYDIFENQEVNDDVELINDKYRYRFSPVSILFCGKYIKLLVVKKTGCTIVGDEKSYLYSFKEFNDYIVFEKITEKGTKPVCHRFDHCIKSICSYFNSIVSDDNVRDILIDAKTPYLLMKRGSMYADGFHIINHPILKDISFAKMVDPVSAFQEISLFLGGVIANNNDDIGNVSDKDLLISKGFHSMSFKKRK